MTREVVTEDDPLAIYLHWPYCARICPYCDFNVHLNRREGEADALIEAMLTDLTYWRDWTGERSVGSVHFGGGTPSLLKPAQMERLITRLDQLWGLNGAQLAIEANPNDMTETRVADWAALGLNRLSIGVQSFDNGVLGRLGRDHDGEGARRAVELAMGQLSSVSVDLIFGVAGEEDGRLSRDLYTLLDLGVPHISTYQLTIEPGTAFARAEARGQDRAVSEERSADDFEAIQSRLETYGFHHYEVSNFARTGHESRHNLAYWRGQDYVGVGPGAHGRLWTSEGRVATETELRPVRYIEAVREAGTGLSAREVLSAEDAAQEYVLMGLRIDEGLSISRLEAVKGSPLIIDPDLVEGGWVEQNGDRLRATPQGRAVLDAVTAQILA